MGKKIIFISLIIFQAIFVFRLNAQTGWQTIFPKPVSYAIGSSFFFNENSGIIYAGKEILKTTNGGINWYYLLKDSLYIGSMYFLNENTGWISSDYNAILKTTNGGLNWERFPSDSLNFDEMHFINSNTGWGINNSYLRKTTNGGANWFTQSNIYGTLRDVYFINENTGIITHGGGIHRTTDGGNNWILVNNTHCYEIEFINQNTGFTGAYIGKILKTTNSGLDWVQVYSGLTSNFIDVSFSDSLNGWLIGNDNGAMIRTTDCGAIWTPIYGNGLCNYTEINFINPNTGWIFTVDNKILKSTNGGLNTVELSKTLTGNLYSIQFLNGNTGFACGYYDSVFYPNYKQILYKSTDGGENWNKLFSGRNGDFYSMYFIDENTGVAGAGNGKIWRTSNGGLNWDSNSVPNTYSINHFKFVNPNTGCAATNGGILKTTDSGLNWNFVKTFGQYECIFMLNQNTGWAGGYWMIFSKTTNGGNNWTDYTLPMGFQNWVTSIHFFDENTGIAAGATAIFKTTNGGSNWTYTYIENFDAYRLTFKGNTGWALDYYGSIMRSTNRGDNWVQTRYYDGLLYNSIFFIDENTGWVAGRYGAILKTTNGGVWIKKNENILPEKYSLLQNYPNPFNSMTNIKFQIINSGNVSLKVIDILGKEVAVIVNEYFRTGSYEVSFNAEGLTSGIYFCILTAGNFTEVKKMILLK